MGPNGNIRSAEDMAQVTGIAVVAHVSGGCRSNLNDDKWQVSTSWRSVQVAREYKLRVSGDPIQGCNMVDVESNTSTAG